MKSTSVGSAVSVFLLLSAILTASPQSGESRIKIEKRRFNYFLIPNKLPREKRIAKTGSLYREGDKNPIGRFRIIERNRTHDLCEIYEINTGVDKNQIKWAVISADGLKPSDGLSQRGLEVNLPKGTVFFDRIHEDSGYYISRAAVPLILIRPLNLSGIKRYLREIERRLKEAYESNLVTLETIGALGLKDRFQITGSDRVYLGTSNGKLSMIYIDQEMIRTAEISSATLKKFDSRIYFYILLKRRN